MHPRRARCRDGSQCGSVSGPTKMDCVWKSFQMICLPTEPRPQPQSQPPRRLLSLDFCPCSSENSSSEATVWCSSPSPAALPLTACWLVRSVLIQLWQLLHFPRIYQSMPCPCPRHPHPQPHPHQLSGAVDNTYFNVRDSIFPLTFSFRPVLAPDPPLTPSPLHFPAPGWLERFICVRFNFYYMRLGQSPSPRSWPAITFALVYRQTLFQRSHHEMADLDGQAEAWKEVSQKGITYRN